VEKASFWNRTKEINSKMLWKAYKKKKIVNMMENDEQNS
jgi:hypothetical protein